MSKKKFFHYTSVLSVLHNRILNDEAYNLLSFLVGYNVSLNNFIEAREKCLDYLIHKFPKLVDIKSLEAFKCIDNIQEGDILCDAMIVENWLNENCDTFLVYGENIEIAKMKQECITNTKAENLVFLHQELTKLWPN